MSGAQQILRHVFDKLRIAKALDERLGLCVRIKKRKEFDRGVKILSFRLLGPFKFRLAYVGSLLRSSADRARWPAPQVIVSGPNVEVKATLDGASIATAVATRVEKMARSAIASFLGARPTATAASMRGTTRSTRHGWRRGPPISRLRPTPRRRRCLPGGERRKAARRALMRTKKNRPPSFPDGQSIASRCAA